MKVLAEAKHGSPSRETALAIEENFATYHAEFNRITRQARARFEQCAWPLLQHDAEERLDLYKNYVNKTVACLKDRLGEEALDKSFWAAVKEQYTRRIADRGDFDLAQSFYNSVTMRIVPGIGIDPEIQYIGSELLPPAEGKEELVYNEYAGAGSTQELIRAILESYEFRGGYKDAGESAALVAERIDGYLRQTGWEGRVEAIELARPVFYRSQRAFLVGRIRGRAECLPLVLALSNTGSGVVVDAVLLTEDEVSIIFSFARWYFHVETEKPQALVRFVKAILPLKPVAELYISLGYDKHGKTEFYRDLMRHIAHSTDKFVIAPGARGMVMVVFTLPSYHVVFKIIKDFFDYPKTTTRREVRERYHLVFKHDRGGRLVDAQEFTRLRFDKSRFSPALLEELLRVAASTVSVDGDYVLIEHLYVERRLTPLDVFVRESDGEAVNDAVVDYGQAIKDLAATNIFPGDILLKNFGVTRHGRVVFYDYDELCLLTECLFRKMPESEDSGEELYSEPWFSVGERDVFPEEFPYFLGLPPPLKETFTQAHGELFDADFWTWLQDRYRDGEIIDVLPYREESRLAQPTAML